MTCKCVARLVCLTALALLCSTAISAQTPASAPAASGGAQTISANPFLLMYKVFNVEFERRHTDSSTWGLSTSMFGFSDADYRNLNLFYRYYPQNAALNGFYIGGRAGVHRVSIDSESASFAGAGFEVGYNRLLGRDRNVAVGVGAGVTRLFGGSLHGASLTIPTIRLLNLGWSF